MCLIKVERPQDANYNGNKICLVLKTFELGVQMLLATFRSEARPD